MKKIFVVITTLTLSACAYSKEEMAQKVRENEALINQMTERERAQKKCEADYASALAQVDDLKKKLVARGVNLDNLTQSLEEQRRANDEYRRRAEQLDALNARLRTLRAKLQPLSAQGVSVSVRDNRMLIQLPAEVLFRPGQDRLKSDASEVLKPISDILRGDADLSARDFQVAAHTDAKPLSGSRFDDHWSLSAMRARAVLLFLVKPLDQQGGGLNERRWSVAGYGSNKPVASNDSEEERKRNQRIELVVQPNAEEMLNLNGLVQ